MKNKIIVPDDFIPAALVFTCHSDKVDTDCDGLYYQALFSTKVKWTLFKSFHYEDNLATFKETGHSVKALYALYKHNKKHGVVIGHSVQEGKNAGKPYLLCVPYKQPGVRRRSYFIFDLADDYSIPHKTKMFFHMKNELL